MKALGSWLVALSALALSGCEGDAHTYTLYRNSTFGTGERVHWATFDTSESSPIYNLNNCLMAARLLNANVDASAEAEGKPRDPSVGFWCEPGKYKNKGSVPNAFHSAFPTDA